METTKGTKVMVTTAFYGGKQKGILTGRYERDTFLDRDLYEVRITSRREIYGGAKPGEVLWKSRACLQAR